MKILYLTFCLACFSVMRVQSKPQITKLFPTQENMDVPQQESKDNSRPLDRFFEKLRATYNFVFRKPENTSNVEKILAKNASNPNVEALKLIWTNTMHQNSDEVKHSQKSQAQRTYLAPDDSWVNDIQALDRLKPLEPLELVDEANNEKDLDVEIIAPQNNFEFPVTFSRHFVDWLGSLFGITYGVYSKFARIFHNNETAIRIH